MTVIHVSFFTRMNAIEIQLKKKIINKCIEFIHTIIHHNPLRKKIEIAWVIG